MVESPVNPLSKLKLDQWYMVLMPIGTIILIFSIFVSNKEWSLFGIGFMLIGMGEWKNWKWIHEEQTQTAYSPYIVRNIPVRKEIRDLIKEAKGRLTYDQYFSQLIVK